MKLNESQELAANHKDGPCLIVAVPGSGKTRLLVERTARLIESGVNPSSILCVTFTNKAATEMRERIYERLGMDEGAKQPFIGTFHSFCSKVLRGLGDRIGYGTFNIIDDGDQKDLLSQIGRQAGQKISKPECGYIASVVNNWRESLEDEDRLEERMKDDSYVAIALTYLERIKANQLIDFSGLLCEVLRLFDEHPHLLEKMQNRFNYIQVDEVQDTSVIQFRIINLLSEKHHNVLMVGDISQCVDANTLIMTNDGDVAAKDVKPNMDLLTGRGRGKIIRCKSNRIYKSQSDKCRTIETLYGNTIVSTDDHIFFAGFTDRSPQKFLVYLMYKHGVGYRIGVTSVHRPRGGTSGHKTSFSARLRSQGADDMWFLSSHDDIRQALLEEAVISAEYGMPQWVFVSTSKNRAIVNQDNIDELFRRLDTHRAARIIAQDKGIDLNYPHHSSISISADRRRNIIMTQCSHGNSVFHSLSAYGQDMKDGQRLIDCGFKINTNHNGWRLQTGSCNLAVVDNKIRQIENALAHSKVIMRSRVGDQILPYCPAGQLLPGMMICMSNGKDIYSDVIKSVNVKDGTIDVVDIDVEKTHNFIANGFVVHNSIYGWRGARCQNIMDFIDMHEKCRQITLSLNYRSTPEIIEAADQLIRHNSSHMAEEFVTENPSGADVQCHGFKSQFEEAEYIGHQVMHVVNTLGYNPEDIAILYRMNSFSEPIEQVFAKCGIAYQIIGGGSFYDRKEIKDCISMLRFLVNPHDGIAFHRVCKCMGGIGDITVGKIENDAISGDSDILQVVDTYAKDGKTKKVREACAKIGSLYRREWDKVPTADLISDLTNGMDFEDHLQSYCKSDDEKFNERIENVKQLVDSAANSGLDVVKYLENVALVSTADKDSKEGQVSLMTCHAAKGLEFPVVFIIGVEKDILPHRRSVIESPDGLEEERRLCYVGMTRAKEHLMLSYCSYRRHYVGGRGATPVPSGPSMFLVESGLLRKEDVFQESRYDY